MARAGNRVSRKRKEVTTWVDLAMNQHSVRTIAGRTIGYSNRHYDDIVGRATLLMLEAHHKGKTPTANDYTAVKTKVIDAAKYHYRQDEPVPGMVSNERTYSLAEEKALDEHDEQMDEWNSLTPKQQQERRTASYAMTLTSPPY